MILRALYDYYDRCGEGIAPMQMAYTIFDYAIVIDEEGNFQYFEKLGLGKEGLPLLVFRPEERTSAPVAHCLGDNGSYVLGLKDIKEADSIDDKAIESQFEANKRNHEAFKQDVDTIYLALSNNANVKAVHGFYQNYSKQTIKVFAKDALWSEICKSLVKNITFLIKGHEQYVCCDEDVIKYKIESAINNNKEQICLVTGDKLKPVNSTYSSFIVGGKSNAKLVSFQENSGYDSYGKKKCLNACISENAEFKYTTALLKLISKGSHNKFVVGSRTFVFWASSNTEAARQAEESLFDMLGFADNNDDPNRRIENVRAVFNAIYSGQLKTSLDDRFYILGLAPNSARIAVVYWSELPLREFAEKISCHFEDMEIIDTRKEKKPYMGIKDMLSTVTLGGKASEATPNLPDAIVKSIFEALPYPYTLFASCIRRIRAEQEVRVARIAILKAYLNRLNNNNNTKIQVMLDKENTNQGYLCGRLFAVLDKIQEDANHINSIRERYMNAASATPSSVFATILNLSSHHSEKLNEGGKIFYEKLKQEIIDKLSANGFPAHLDLQDQGRFFIGYYHQRQDFFVSKKSENIDEE